MPVPRGTADPGEAVTVEDVLGERGDVGAGDLRAALGVSKSQLGRMLAPLVEQGRVVREGMGAGTRYRQAEHRATAIVEDLEREDRRGPLPTEPQLRRIAEMLAEGYGLRDLLRAVQQSKRSPDMLCFLQ